MTAKLLKLALLLLVSSAGPAQAAEPTAAQAVSEARCLGCHTVSNDVPVHAIYSSAHGGLTSGSSLCTVCHGNSDAHQVNPTVKTPDVSFGPQWRSEPEAQNQVCLNCHQASAARYWTGSVHADEDLSCTGCHQLHTRFEPVRDRQTQAETCFNCHKTVQSSVHLQSRHPILEGRTACVDCHDPHGAATAAELVQPTLNDTCFQCHADKRGPFLFEHQPAAEDCSLCHVAHGSVNPALLRVRTPFLCQQCHSAAFHPSQLADGQGLPGNQPGSNLLGKNCLNCHSQIHGSNHPSGARLTR